MTKYPSAFVGIVLALTLSSAPLYAQNLTREQEIEFNARSAAFDLKQLDEHEKTIAALPKKQIAVGSAAGLINKLAQHKKETGKFNQQEFTFILSIVLYRLSHLSQVANMPPAVIACHMAEARNLENISQGKPPVMPNCRAEAYGSNFQSESIIELSQPSWKPNHELLRKWVVNAFSYAEAIGKVTNYGVSTAK